MSVSGRWRGWYAYEGRAGHHPMDMALTQAGERLTGGGMDDVGAFTIRGHCGTDGGVTWLKRYSTHGVDYEGRCEGRFIRGGWRMGSGRGTFCLWPDGSGPAEEESEAKPQEEPARAGQSLPSSSSRARGRSLSAGQWPRGRKTRSS